MDQLETSLFRYIWRNSKKEQIVILAMVLISLPFYYISLDLPKQIVNDGIQGQGFTSPGSTQSYFGITLPIGDGITLFQGFDLEQQGALLSLSFAFLSLVVVNGLFKFVINTRKGRLGERMLRRLRFQLTDRLLRFPLPYLRRVKQAEAATMIKDEVEPLGGFIGEAFVNPVFLGGQALTAMVFIMVQSVWLGSVALAIVLLQAFLIPKLRTPILRLGRRRQLTARQLAGRIGEVVAGGVEIHAHDTSNLERGDVVKRLGEIFGIRYEIFRRKFFVKFLNNFLAQLTPFIFYSVGGVLAIQGQLDIGALVAVIAAYKDLPSPIKELIDWDQQRQDVQIKYEQVIEQFAPPVLLDSKRQAVDAEPLAKLEGEIKLASATIVDDAENKVLDSVSWSVPLTSHVALVGPSGGGREVLAGAVAALEPLTSGNLSIGGYDLDSLPEAVTGRRLSFVDGAAYLFGGSLGDNLVYSLKHAPNDRGELDPEERERLHDLEREAHSAGNPFFDTDADWIDYAAAGVSNLDELREKLIDTCRLVEMDDDLYRFGLAARFDPETYPGLAAKVLEARSDFTKRLAEEDEEELVVRFDPEQFNANASLAENLLFGLPLDDAFKGDALPAHPVLREALKEADLLDDLEKIGLQIARTMVEIFADLPPGHPFFEQFSFIEAEELPEFKTLVVKTEKGGLAGLSDEEERRLMKLALNYIEERHRLSLIDDSLEERIVKARKAFAERLPEAERDGIAFYEPESYNAAATLQDNILFGRLAHGQARADETIQKIILDILEERGLRHEVMAMGMEYDIGFGGKRLSNAQQQKLALARALVKEPDLLIVSNAMTALDGTSQHRLTKAILEARAGRGVLWALHRPDLATLFGEVAVLRDGRLVESGEVKSLEKEGSELSALLASSGSAG
ncbi:MAG: ABC transporter transmembrane domain-containing protein [Limibacillus sp.]